MKLRGREIQHSKGLIAHLQSLRIAASIELGFNGQAGSGGRASDEIHDDLMADQGTPSPVLGNVAEHSVLDLVLLTGPGRKMTDSNLQRHLVGKLLEGH